MNSQSFAIVVSLMLLTGDLVRGLETSALDANGDVPLADDLAQHSDQDLTLMPAESNNGEQVSSQQPSSTTRAPPPSTTTTTHSPCTPNPCSPSQLLIPIPQFLRPCGQPCQPRPLPPRPTTTTTTRAPVTRPPCRPVCPLPVPQCNPCGAVAVAPLRLPSIKPIVAGVAAVGLKALKVWKLKLAAPALLAGAVGAKVVGALVLLPAKLLLKAIVIKGLIAKPFIIAKALVVAGVVKLAAKVIGIPVAIVTGVKATALGVKALLAGAAASFSTVLSTPLNLARGVSLVVIGRGAEALSRVLDTAGRSQVQIAQTLVGYGAAKEALGKQDLVWGFESQSCDGDLTILDPVFDGAEDETNQIDTLAASPADEPLMVDADLLSHTEDLLATNQEDNELHNSL